MNLVPIELAIIIINIFLLFTIRATHIIQTEDYFYSLHFKNQITLFLHLISLFYYTQFKLHTLAINCLKTVV